MQMAQKIVRYNKCTNGYEIGMLQSQLSAKLVMSKTSWPNSRSLAHVNANISSARFNSYRQGNRRTWMRNMMLNLGTKQMSQNMLIDVPCTLNVWLWFTEFLSNQQR